MHSPLENQGEQSRVQKHLKALRHGFVLAMLLVPYLGALMLGDVGGSVVDIRQFARVVKGVDLRSTAGNCARVRTPQLTLCPSNSLEI